MTHFVTTRGGSPVGLREAVLRGLAPDGGLFVPAAPARLDPALFDRAGTPFSDTARAVARAFLPFAASEDLDAIVRSAFDFPVPLVEVEPGRYVLELFHGPTLAFKDVGARFMAGLMQRLEKALTPATAPHARTVLVATSGDTGGAVASAFHGIDGVRVVVLFPRDGISARQRRQMTTLGGNVDALAVQGTFDDCQRLVKAAFADEALSARHGLTSANSINIARLVPQSFYYVHTARELGSVHFVVPSGNLGNLCAGLMAWRAGMPVLGFTAAVNANRGFADYLAGEPFVSRPSRPTAANAMDVGDPSNLERIRWLFGGDDDAVRRAVLGASVSDAEAASCIARVHAATGYVMDPHTAIGYEAACRAPVPSEGPVVVLGTAHPAKFPETVQAAIGRSIDAPQALRETWGREERVSEIGPTSDSLERVLDDPSE